MEILNNLWTLLISPNEFVTTLVTLPLLFVETYLTMCIFLSFLKIKSSKRQKIVYITLISGVFLFSNYFVISPFNLLVNYGIMALLIYKIFNIKRFKLILSIIIPFAIFTLTGTLIMNPMLKIFNIAYDQLGLIPIYKLIYMLTNYALIFFVILFENHRNVSIFSFDNINANSSRTIIINLVVAIITLAIQLVLTFYYINVVPLGITLFNFMLLFSYILISFYSLTKVMKLDIATRDLENAESYNNSLTVLYDNVRGFKHDFDNMVNIIGGYIKSNDMNGLKKYYTDLEKECVQINNIQLLNPNIINNPGIYNLIVSKYQKATYENIQINFEFFFDFDSLHMPIYEFSRILGILLDNALEAAKECDEKIINLIFRESKKNNTQIVIIENTYKNKEIDTEEIFKKGFTGKENHSGIGLWEVKQIISKNNNVSLHTITDDKLFKQQLEIYY